MKPHTDGSHRGSIPQTRSCAQENAGIHIKLYSINERRTILNGLQERIYDTGGRIQAFFDANDAVLGSINKSGMRAELDAAVTALGQSSTSQAAGQVNAIGETANQ